MAPATLFVALVLATSHPPAAQTPPAVRGSQAREPLSTSLKQAYDSAIRNLWQVVVMAPQEVYEFKPTPEARSFGAQIAHVVDVMNQLCALASGSTSRADPGIETSWKTRADVMEAMQKAQQYCDTVYSLMTDARALEPIDVAPRVPRVRLLIDNVSHIRQHYGNVRTYLRLNGIGPPPTEHLPVQKPSE
jgi:hypothetical protein